jgi:putative phage-type endonuclease
MNAKILVSTKGMSKEEWLAHRVKGIGGSEVAAVAGVNPWSSPLEVYLNKIGSIPAKEANEKMEWGNRLEDVVAQKFSDEHPEFKIERVEAILQHPEQPIFIADIDRLAVNKETSEEAILEIKTTGMFTPDGWKEDRIPDYVMCQVQWYLGVTGLSKAFIGVLVGGNHYLELPVERNDEVIAYLQKIALDFWNSFVIPKVPPAVDGSDSSGKVLDFLYPEGDPNQEVELGHDEENWINIYFDAKERLTSAKNDKELAENMIKAKLGASERGTCGDKIVTWKTIRGRRLDGDALQLEMPEVYKKYYRPAKPYRKFGIR